MPFVNTQNLFPPDFTRIETGIGLSLSGSVAGGGQPINQVNLRLKLGGTVTGGSRFVLTTPSPILTQLDENAFAGRFYTARLLNGSGQSVLIEEARIDKPKDAIGERVSIVVGKKMLSEINPDESYTFQIGTRTTVNGAISWETIVNEGKVNSRQYQMAKRNNLPADALTFETLETKKNKLNRVPMKNFIFYDSTRTTVENSEIEKIYDSNGDYIRTQKVGYTKLTLYKIFAFVAQKCGLVFDSQTSTNIPNFEIARADLGYKQSYREFLNGLCGQYKPLIRVLGGDVLRIQTKFAGLPADFSPRSLTIDSYNDLQLTLAETTDVACVEVTYVDSQTQSNAFFDENEPVEISENNEFGDDDFSETRISRKYRSWYHTSNPSRILDKKLISEVISTYVGGVLTDRETTQYFYDGQARQTGMTQTIESTVPDLQLDPPEAVLLETKVARQSQVWQTDARNFRRVYPKRITTQVRGLIATDSENQAIGKSGELEDYSQDFEKVYEHGNLTPTMASSFGPIETTVKTLTPLGNGQWEWRIEVRDDIRGKTKLRDTEAVTGDPTINSVGATSRQFIIWRDGETIAGYDGGEIMQLSVGELAFEFAEALATFMMQRRIDGKQDGTVQIPGYDKSLDRGTHFIIKDRAGADICRVVCEGVSTVFGRLGAAREQRVLTTVNISEV